MDVDGSTPQEGDRNLSVGDVANELIQRRQERTAPEPAASPSLEAEAEADGDDLPTPEELEREALGEDPDKDEDEGEDAPDLGAENQDDDDDPDAGEPDDQGAEYSFETLDEVAEAAGMEIDDFLKIKANTLVDGVAGEVTLGELLKGHQLESSFTRKNQAWVEQKRHAEQEFEAQREKLADHFQITTEVFNHAQQALVSDFESVNWAELQASDTEQYQRLRQQFGERQGRLNHAIKLATERLQKAREEQEAAKEDKRNRDIAREQEMLAAKVPEWQDEERRSKEAAEIGKYLLSVGFEADEISNLTDHRMMILARAALGLAGPTKKQVDLAKKKVKKVPRLVKSGAQKPRGSDDSKKISALKAQVKRTGKTGDVAELLIARRQNKERNARRKRAAPR